MKVLYNKTHKMLQTMLVAGITPLQNKDELSHWENRPFSGGVWIETNNRKPETTRNRTIKKKSKRVRTAFTTDQIRSLEETFLLNKYINSELRRELSRTLNIGEKCIKIWFQNRRMKAKRASSESSDTSSETIGRETVSPYLIPHDSLYQDQQNHHNSPEIPCYPQFDNYRAYNENPDQIYEPNINLYTKTNYNSNIQYYGEANPYYAQFYPLDANVNNNFVNQNEYQYSNEMYNYQDATDFNVFY